MCQEFCPRGEGASTWAGIPWAGIPWAGIPWAGTPPGQVHPPWAGTPMGRYTPHMVNERAVRILLECILV